MKRGTSFFNTFNSNKIAYGFLSNTAFFWINLTKCSAPGGINFLILILIWSTFWEKNRNETSSFCMNVNDFLGTHLRRLSKTQTFRINNLSAFLSLTAMSWPEPNEKADRSTGVQVQGQDGLSCQLVNAENCSLVRTCTREYTHHCPRHHHHHRHRHLQEKTKTKTKTRTSPIVRNCRQEQTPPCPDRRTDMWSSDRNIQQYWRNSQKAGLTNEWITYI